MSTLNKNVEELRVEWNTIHPIGKLNMVIGAMFLIGGLTQMLNPSPYTITALVGALIISKGSQMK